MANRSEQAKAIRTTGSPSPAVGAPSSLALSDATVRLLRCAVCRAPLTASTSALHCTNPTCQARFPVTNGIPVLINEQNSLFSIADILQHNTITLNASTKQPLKQVAQRLVPPISRNVKARQNYAHLSSLLNGPAPQRVLVVGSGIEGHGMHPLRANPAVELIASDVMFGRDTALICDAHDIPFADESFNAVVVQAVLEHVVDPLRCVAEIHRVLQPAGLVYAETPFMQQVHLGRHDFTRFTRLGHRRLFRMFHELSSGAVCGPGMALAWAYQYFLLSFVSSRRMRDLVRIFARCTSFWLTAFDPLLIDRPGTADAASAYYFLGRKSSTPLPDSDLLQTYRGLW